MSPEQAAVLAHIDGRMIRELALLAAEECPADDATVVIDGTRYAPSWRALPGGAQVWNAERDLRAADYGEDVDAYSETLDDELEWISDADLAGWLGWEDGCIWYYGPTYESEDQ